MQLHYQLGLQDYKDYKDYKVQIFNYKRNCQDNNHISSIINKNCKVENQDHSSIQHICPISILSSVIVSSNSILKYCSPAGVCAARQRFARWEREGAGGKYSCDLGMEAWVKLLLLGIQ